MRRFLKVVLLEAGFAPFEAADGSAALSLLSRIKPVAILLDIEMPGWNGFETCERIRSYHPNLRCPIIFVTNRKTEADVRRARAVGGDHFLIKPLSPELFLDRLSHFLKIRFRREEAETAEES